MKAAANLPLPPAVQAILEQHGYTVLQMRRDTGDIIRAVLAQYKREDA